MSKKTMCALAVFALLTAFIGTVSADSLIELEVDKTSDIFKADTWSSSWPLEDAFAKTLMNGAAPEMKKFQGTVNAASTGNQGSVTIDDNGSAVLNVYFPFTETVMLQKVTLKFPVILRRYYFKLYTSMNGTNWDEVTTLGEGAAPVSLNATCDSTGAISGPAVSGCFYAASPAANDGTGDTLPTTINTSAPIKANYMRFKFYGAQNADNTDLLNGIVKPTSAAVGFNHLRFEGTLFVESTSSGAVSSIASTASEPINSTADSDSPAVVRDDIPATGNNTPVVLIACVSAFSVILFAAALKKKYSGVTED